MKLWVLLDKSMWQYLLEPKSTDTDRSKLAVMWCRFNAHPAGVWWYNPSGYEPDMHCKNCGDDLG